MSLTSDRRTLVTGARLGGHAHQGLLGGGAHLGGDAEGCQVGRRAHQAAWF